MLAKIDLDLQRSVIMIRTELGARVADSANWYHVRGWLADA